MPTLWEMHIFSDFFFTIGGAHIELLWRRVSSHPYGVLHDAITAIIASFKMATARSGNKQGIYSVFCNVIHGSKCTNLLVVHDLIVVSYLKSLKIGHQTFPDDPPNTE